MVSSACSVRTKAAVPDWVCAAANSPSINSVVDSFAEVSSIVLVGSILHPTPDATITIRARRVK